MARKRGLGRGLAALIPQPEEIEEEKKEEEISQEKTQKEEKTAEEKSQKQEKRVKEPAKSEDFENQEDDTKAKIFEISLDQIQPNPDQPRKRFNEESLNELSDSIKKYGLLQPIVVLKKEDREENEPPYLIIAGERRYRAAKQAGLKEIPVIIREDSEKRGALLSIIENIQREDLNPLEEAQAYKEIMADHDLTQAALANLLGKSRSYIANISRLDGLDPESKKALTEGKLSSSQARTLLSEPNLKKRKKLRDLFINGKINVNAAEKKMERKPRKKTKKNIFVKDLEDQLSKSLGTPVNILSRKKGWDIQISCYSEEDLNHFTDRLLRGDD